MRRVSMLVCLLGCHGATTPQPPAARPELLALELTEINYNPLGDDVVTGDDYEFVELKNTGPAALDLTDVAFTQGITYAFDAGATVGAGEFVVVVANAAAFQQRYGFAPTGQFTGRLNNTADRITLSDLPAQSAIVSVEYRDRSPWPADADGSGRTLVPVAMELGDDPGRPAHWRSSFAVNGSPGKDDPPVAYVNEILVHTDLPEKDSIELFNPNRFPLDVSGWFLTDNKAIPTKYQMPAGTVIAGRDYLVFDQDQFNNPDAPTPFSLSEHGEEAYVVADSSGCATGYCDGFAFGDQENGVAFGRYVTSTGEVHLVRLQTPTLGAANARPAVGPLVITELMYSPPAGRDEYVELQNTGMETLSLSEPSLDTHTWKIDGMGFAFPPSIMLAPGEVVLVIPAGVDEATFRAEYDVPPAARIFPGAAALPDFGDTLTLMKAWKPYTRAMQQVLPFIVVETVAFTNASPWPPEANGLGSALHRKDPGAYANDPIDWEAAAPSPGGP